MEGGRDLVLLYVHHLISTMQRSLVCLHYIAAWPIQQNCVWQFRWCLLFVLESPRMVVLPCVHMPHQVSCILCDQFTRLSHFSVCNIEKQSGAWGRGSSCQYKLSRIFALAETTFYLYHTLVSYLIRR